MGKKSKSNAKKKGKQARATKQASAPNASTQPTRQEGRPVPKLLRVGAPATGTTSSAGNATSVYDPHEYQNPYPSEVRKPVGWLRIPIKGAKQVTQSETHAKKRAGTSLWLPENRALTHDLPNARLGGKPPQASDDDATSHACNYCKAPAASFFCECCREAWYCGSECQRQDFERHELACRTNLVTASRNATAARKATAPRRQRQQRSNSDDGGEHVDVCVICCLRQVQPVEVRPCVYQVQRH